MSSENEDACQIPPLVGLLLVQTKLVCLKDVAELFRGEAVVVEGKWDNHAPPDYCNKLKDLG